MQRLNISLQQENELYASGNGRGISVQHDVHRKKLKINKVISNKKFKKT